jgi:hypothetical protein
VRPTLKMVGRRGHFVAVQRHGGCAGGNQQQESPKKSNVPGSRDPPFIGDQCVLSKCIRCVSVVPACGPLGEDSEESAILACKERQTRVRRRIRIPPKFTCRALCLRQSHRLRVRNLRERLTKTPGFAPAIHLRQGLWPTTAPKYSHSSSPQGTKV